MTRLTASIVRAAFSDEVMGLEELARGLDRSEKLVYSYLQSNPQHFESLGGGRFRLMEFKAPVQPGKRVRQTYKEGYKEFFR